MNVTCKFAISFFISWLLFKITPLLLQQGEFSNMYNHEIVSWFSNIQSTMVFILFWSVSAPITIMFRSSKRSVIFISAALFGISVSIFIFPIEILTASDPQLDLISFILPYIIFVVFLMGAKSFNKERSEHPL